MPEALSDFDNLPPEVAAELQTIARRRKIMDALTAQSQEPLKGQMVGRVFVPPSPVQGLAQMANAWAGSSGGKDLDKQYAQTGQKYRDMQASEISRINKIAEGVPGWADPDNPTAAKTGGTPGDPMGAISAAMLSQFPVARNYGEAMGKVRAAQEQHAADAAARLEQARITQQQRTEDRLDLQKNQFAQQENMARLAAGLRPPPQQQVVQTEDGPMILSPGSTSAVPITGPGGEQVKPKSTSRPLPAFAINNMLENSQNLRKAERALALISGEKVGDAVGDASATGWKGYVPDVVLQKIDPAGVSTRAAVADLGSMIIHDRSGAAVTASETPRLMPFIPGVTDDAASAEKKLKQFVDEYKKMSQEAATAYKESGYNVPDTAFNFDKAVSSNAPDGVDQELWDIMTPEEQAEWQN